MLKKFIDKLLILLKIKKKHEIINIPVRTESKKMSETELKFTMYKEKLKSERKIRNMIARKSRRINRRKKK